jgi:hypothetical protein
VAELGRLAVLRIGQHAAEPGARGQHAINLVQRDLPLRPVGDHLGHARGCASPGIRTPVLRQEQPQADTDRHLGPGQGERDQRLTVRPLPKLTTVLPLHPDRVPTLLHQGRVVHHQHRVRPAHQPVGGPHQLLLQRSRRPGRGGDEMMQLLGVSRRYPGRHGLDALALARQDQALEVEWCPVSLRLAPQPRQERLEPALEFTLPAVRRPPLHHAPPPRALSRQERATRQNVAE